MDWNSALESAGGAGPAPDAGDKPVDSSSRCEESWNGVGIQPVSMIPVRNIGTILTKFSEVYMQTKFKTILIAVVGTLAGCLMLTGCGQQSSAGARTQTGPPEVGVETIQTQRVPIVSELPGRTCAYLVAEVRPQVGGIIQKRQFTEGADVKSGEVLYQIDPATYQAAFASAKAAVSKAEASVETTRLKAARHAELVKIKAVSQQEYDNTIGSLKEAEADVEASKAALESARINLAYTRVTSPITGRIGKSSVTVGALVTASQSNALSTVQQLDPIYVDVTQSSAELLNLKQLLSNGQLKTNGNKQAKAKLLLEDGTQYPLEGVLEFSDVTVDQSTGSITLRAVFPNPDHVLLPGMYVRALLEEGVNEHAILAPQQGVTRNTRGKPIALVVDGSDKVELRTLKVARTVGDKWLVSEGLNAGDRLIVEGLQKVRPGSPVKVVQLGTAATVATSSADAGK